MRGHAQMMSISSIPVFQTTRRLKVERFAPVDMCIYCRSTSHSRQPRKLGDEHVIPEGLGGNILLPNAVCGRCEGVTSAFEGRVQRTIFGPVRIHLGLPTKRPRDRPKTLPVSAYFGDRQDATEIQIPIRYHPVLCLVSQMNPPRLLAKPDGGEQIIRGGFLEDKSIVDAKMQNIGYLLGARNVSISSPPLGYADLKLTLAKIGHSLFCGLLGIDGFHHFLPDIIRRQDGIALNLFVGHSSNEPAKPTSLHHLGVRAVSKGKQTYLVAEVGLFSLLGLPTYDVVVGRLFVQSEAAGRRRLLLG